MKAIRKTQWLNEQNIYEQRENILILLKPKFIILPITKSEN